MTVACQKQVAHFARNNRDLTPKSRKYRVAHFHRNRWLSLVGTVAQFEPEYTLPPVSPGLFIFKPAAAGYPVLCSGMAAYFHFYENS